MAIRTLEPEFHVSGQIKLKQIPELVQAGYKAIVCMRPDGEGWFQPKFAELQKAAEEAGIRMHHIPARPGAVTPEQARALGKVLKSTKGKVLAYCASGNRCTIAYQMARGGSS
jgi:uncharacterized protein (TIGR01244 family)